MANDLELRNTKSESPELTSVFELPLDDIAAIIERESASKVPTTKGNRETPARILQLDDSQAVDGESAEVGRYQTTTVLPVADEVSLYHSGL